MAAKKKPTAKRTKARAPSEERRGEPAWGSLATAHGTAEPVPEHLRALASSEPEARTAARAALIALLHHQSSVYPATAAAVPLLLELAARPDVADRHAILVMLAGMALGDPQAYLTQSGIEREERLVEEEDGPETETWTAVNAGIPLVLPLLDDPDPRVRAAAAFLVAFFPSVKKTAPALRKIVRVPLRGTIDAPSAHARASQMIALGMLDKSAGSTSDLPLFEPPLASPDPVLRASAAIAIAYVSGDRTSGAALEALEEARTLAPVSPEEQPWADGDLGALAALVRGTLRVEPPEALLRDLEARLAQGDRGPDTIELANRLYERVIPKSPPDGREWLREELDPVQSATLAAVATLERCAHSTQARGLFFSPVTLRRFLGHAPPGALDRIVAVGDLRWPAWKAMRAALWRTIREDELHAALEASEPPGSRVEIAAEALRGDYEMWTGEPRWAYAPPAEQTEKRREHRERLCRLLAEIGARAGSEGRAWVTSDPAAQVHIASGFQVAALVALARRGEAIELADLEARTRVLMAKPPVSRCPAIVASALEVLGPERAAALQVSSV